MVPAIHCFSGSQKIVRPIAKPMNPSTPAASRSRARPSPRRRPRRARRSPRHRARQPGRPRRRGGSRRPSVMPSTFQTSGSTPAAWSSRIAVATRRGRSFVAKFSPAGTARAGRSARRGTWWPAERATPRARARRPACRRFISRVAGGVVPDEHLDEVRVEGLDVRGELVPVLGARTRAGSSSRRPGRAPARGPSRASRRSAPCSSSVGSGERARLGGLGDGGGRAG